MTSLIGNPEFPGDQINIILNECTTAFDGANGDLSVNNNFIAKNINLTNPNDLNFSTTITATATQNYPINLPPTQGLANQALVNNGSGVLSWATPISYFSTAERDSLTWIVSDIIYNRSYFRLETYNGASWVSIDGTVGQLAYFHVTTAPKNYQVADGSSVSRTGPGVYSELWTLNTSVNPSLTPITCTIANPAVITKLAHGLTNSQRVRFTTTGSLPTGLVIGTDYIVTVLSGSTFRLSTTIALALAGTFITSSGTQSGIHSYTNTLYGQGNGTTTQTILDGRGLFLRGHDNSSAVNPTAFNGNGSLQGDAIRNITGQFNCGFEQAPNPTGAFTVANATGDGVSGGGLDFYDVIFNASNVVPTATENRPKHLCTTLYIKYL